MSKDIWDNYRNTFETKISARAKEKLPYSEKLGANIFSWSSDLEGHAKNCVERSCELANKTTQQFSKSLERGRIEICWRIVTSMLSNCSEMLVLGTYWTTRHSMASKQTCTSSHQMDQNL